MKQYLKLVSYNLLLMLLGILLLELIFGGWVGRNYGTLVIPIDFERRFNVSKLYSWEGGFTNYSRDIYGLRGNYSSLSNIGILTMGGSTTNEIFISEGYTWSDVLAAQFLAAGTSLTVVNAGIDGQSTIGHLKNFELWIPQIPGIKARYILVYLGINDHALIMANYYQNKQDGLLARRNILKQYVMNNSALYTLFRNIRGIVFARQANLIHTEKSFNKKTWVTPMSPPNVQVFEKKYADDLSLYSNRLIKLSAAIRALGSKPIFVTQHKASYRIKEGKLTVPSGPAGKVSLRDYVGLTAINKVTMDTCNKMKAICIDLANRLNFGNGDHYDGLHTSPQGSKRIGEFLFKALTANPSFQY